MKKDRLPRDAAASFQLPTTKARAYGMPVGTMLRKLILEVSPKQSVAGEGADRVARLRKRP